MQPLDLPAGRHSLIGHPSWALAGTWLWGLREWLALSRARRRQARAAK